MFKALPQDVQVDANIGLTLARLLRSLGLHPVDFNLTVKDGKVVIRSFNFDTARAVENAAAKISEISGDHAFEHDFAYVHQGCPAHP